MPEYFAWKHGLPDDEAARLLLLTGLLPPSITRRETLPEAAELRELLISRWRGLRGRPWAWRLRESATRLISGQDDALRLIKSADDLFALANDDWNSHGRGLRLEINGTEQIERRFLYVNLLRGGAHSAFLRRKAEGELSWSWPLRIGVAGSSQLLAGVSPGSSLSPLFRVFDFKRAPMRANLLLFEASLTEVALKYARSRRPFSTDAVIIYGGIGEPVASVWRRLSFFSEITGAQGVFVFDALDEGRAQSATEGLIAYLSHDLPLDSAVARVAAEHGVSVFSWATRSLAEATSVREQGRLLARRLQQMPDAEIPYDRETLGPGVELSAPGTHGDELPGSDGEQRADAILIKAKELGATLEKRLRSPEEAADRGPVEAAMLPLSFDRESQGAREVAMLAEATAAANDDDAARREARYLQARVETPAGRPVEGNAPLLPARDYVAPVFIGARKSGWLGLDKPLQTPEPPEGRPLLLDVLFWEPQASPKAQIKQLKLPPHGDSMAVKFAFRTAEDQSTFSARIAVYHRNRNLQTGLLRGRVGQEPAAFQFIPDAAPQPKFVGLADRAGVGASIILNDDESGDMKAYVYQDGKAGVGSVTDAPPPPVSNAPLPPVSDAPPLSVDVNPTRGDALAKLTEALGRAITRITDDPDNYQDLSKDGSRKLLLELAQHGSALLNRLRKHTLMGNRFDKVKYIQIVSAHVDAFFPAEYLYNGEAPEDDAKVCGDSEAKPAPDALRSGNCCGAYDPNNPSRTICPLRFWSTSKVIERHAHLPEHTALSGQFQLRSTGVSARDRLLDPLRCAVLGASKKADTADKDTVTDLRAKLDASLRARPVPLSSGWASWAEEIERSRPNLLILLPHHEQAGGFDQLEIGGELRKSVLIGPKQVRWPEDSEARPIVLLIGCQTNVAKVDLESFVPAFQDAGAVIVVSTIATILGRHAGPAAAAIVAELKKREGEADATFGEVMLAVRRDLLASGTPMVLGLTSYGDADWRIGATANDKQ